MKLHLIDFEDLIDYKIVSIQSRLLLSFLKWPKYILHWNAMGWRQIAISHSNHLSQEAPQAMRFSHWIPRLWEVILNNLALNLQRPLKRAITFYRERGGLSVCWGRGEFFSHWNRHIPVWYMKAFCKNDRKYVWAKLDIKLHRSLQIWFERVYVNEGP